MIHSRKVKRIGGLLLCVLLVSSLSAAPASATSEHHEEVFLVELDGDGNADVSVTYTYDLETDSAQAAFEELRTNETAQDERLTRFQNRMEMVAADAANTTGRDMSINDASIDFSTANGGDTGVVMLSVTWNGLAAVEGNRLTVTEPFASGFEPDRPFTVWWPDSYERGDTAPTPATSTDASATWDAGTEFESFSLTVTGSSTSSKSDPAATDGSGSGFGVTAVIAALAAVLLAARRP